MAKKKGRGRPKKSPDDISMDDIREAEKEAAQHYNKEVLPRKMQENRENKEKFDELIQTEHDLLELFNEDRFTIRVMVYGRTIEFKIRPISKGDDLSFMDLDTDIFTDLSDNEQKIVDKMTKGLTLTESEQETFKVMAQEAEKNADTSDRLDMMERLLAQHVTPPSFDGDTNKKIAFWERFPLFQKVMIFKKVMEVIGVDRDTTDKLFQAD